MKMKAILAILGLCLLVGAVSLASDLCQPDQPTESINDVPSNIADSGSVVLDMTTGEPSVFGASHPTTFDEADAPMPAELFERASPDQTGINWERTVPDDGLLGNEHLHRAVFLPSTYQPHQPGGGGRDATSIGTETLARYDSSRCGGRRWANE